MPINTLKEICGCIHLHTAFSDGGSDYGAFIDAAGDAGLDYLCFTDHNNIKGRDAGFEGLSGNGVFVLVGYEHNDGKNLNHYLAFGVDKVAEGLTDPPGYIDAVKRMGGIGFLAHPAEERASVASLPPYPWTRWDADGFDGVELWNQISDWMERLRGWHSLNRLILPNLRLGPAPPKLLERWDAINRRRFAAAIGGVDAHTRRFAKWLLSCVVFPIKVELRGVRTHFFVDPEEWGDASRAGGALLSAMRDGRGFMSNFGRGDARGSRFLLTDAGGAEFFPGRPPAPVSAPAAPPRFPMTLSVTLPRKARMVLIRNGRPIRSATSKSAAWEISEPGVYRVEAHRRFGAWIYTNPFPVGNYPL